MWLIDGESLRSAMYHEAFEKDTGEQKWDNGLWIRYKLFERILDMQTEVHADINAKCLTASEEQLLDMCRVNLKDYQAVLDEIGFTPKDFEAMVFNIFILKCYELIDMKQCTGEEEAIDHFERMIEAAKIHKDILEAI